jgi:hypothetical protein
VRCNTGFERVRIFWSAYQGRKAAMNIGIREGYAAKQR